MAAGGSVPAKARLVASLARPGGNITGMANTFTELRGKQMEILKETIPRLSHVAVLWNAESPSADSGLRHTQSEAQALGLRSQILGVRKADDFARAFQSAKKAHTGAVLITANPLMFTHF